MIGLSTTFLIIANDIACYDYSHQAVVLMTECDQSQTSPDGASSQQLGAAAAAAASSYGRSCLISLNSRTQTTSPVFIHQSILCLVLSYLT